MAQLKITIVLSALFFYSLIPCIAEAKIGVDSLSYEKKAVPGMMYKGTIIIRNEGGKEQGVKLYQTDYLFFSDGRNIYGEPGTIPRSNAEWIDFSPKWLTIPPQQEVAVSYRVRVPQESTLVGTYWSILMVEELPQSLPERSKSGKAGFTLAIKQVIRYGTQIVTHIRDSGDRRLKFFKTRLLKEGERRTLQVDVENIGERLLKPFLWVELYDEEGSYIGRFEGERLRVYPGTSVRYRVDLSKVLKGEYRALVVADCGSDDIFGVTYALKFEK